MIIVSDTSPINYLVLIGEIELLPKLFGQVIIPPAVARELRHPGSPGVVKQWIDSPPAWLEIRDASAIDPTIQLDSGETVAISLALEINADQILLDDKKAVKVALARGLRAAGTLNLLELAAIRKWVDLPAVLANLMKTNFRALPELIQKLLDEDAERKQSHQSGQD
jgi:predicted nucleic acid-binding protein